MTTTKFDTRATVQKTALNRIAPTASPANRVELDNILASLDKQVTPPLEMRATSTPDLVLNIGSISLQDPELDVNHTIPPINNLLPAFASGTVTFPAASGGNAVPSAGDNFPITISTDSFLKVGINLDATGNIVMIAGTEGASEALATNPPLINNTFPIGYVVLEDQSGTIQPITNAKIYQYLGGGGGGSGSGDASSVISRLWDTFSGSIYAELTGVDFAQDQNAHINTTDSTGAFSLVSSTFEFANASETLVTTQLLSYDEFVAQNKDFGDCELAVFWKEDQVDTAATYEISTDAGSSWNAITMERVGSATDTYIGRTTQTFATATLLDKTTAADSPVPIDDNPHEKQAQRFESTGVRVSSALVRLKKQGSPTGDVVATLHADNGGEPAAAVLATSTNELEATNIGSLYGTFTFLFDDVDLPEGTYWLALDGQASYAADLSNFLEFDTDASGAGRAHFAFGSWTVSESESLYITISGQPKDVRLRITSSAGDKALLGYGLFYDKEGIIQLGEKKYQEITFDSNSAPAQFTLNWLPDPELLNVRLKETGQTFSLASTGDTNGYTVSQNDIIFPAGTFTQDTNESFTLVFNQTAGSVDNSDTNANKISTLETKTANYRLVTSAETALTIRDHILADTSSSAFSLTLPSNPAVGASIMVVDAKNSFATNNLTVVRNGNNINGVSSDYTLSTNGDWAEFIYVDATYGWTVRTK